MLTTRDAQHCLRNGLVMLMLYIPINYFTVMLNSYGGLNIAHLSILTSVGYNKKETSLKKFAGKYSNHYTLFTQSLKCKIFS